MKTQVCDSHQLREGIVKAVDGLRPVVSDIAVSLYERPETGLNEHFAADKLVGILQENGFQVERGLAGLPTSFLARKGTGKPVIAFMAEYDALPAIGHGCGHNLMAACAVAAGIACSTVARRGCCSVGESRFSGDLGQCSEDGPSWIVLGTPAEETIGGKVVMAEKGVFDGIDAAFIAHPGQRDSVGGGTPWASHPIEITFHGRSAHAGGNPQGGINALDACVQAYIAIRNLRNSLRDDVRIAGIITHGGDAQNIIPEKTSMRFTLRCTDWRYLEDVLIPSVKRCAQGAALSTGTTVEFHHHENLFRDTLAYPVLRELARNNFECIGHEIPPMTGGGGGVTDVGNVTWATPSIQIGFRIGDARGHSVEMADATITDQGIDATVDAAKVLSLCAVDLMCSPKLLEAAKAHLAKRLQG